jgi:hypothetical protein
MSLRLAYRYLKGEFNDAVAEIEAPIAAAGTAALTEAGNRIKLQGRAQIRSAGFSDRFANALRIEQFPARNQPSKGTKTPKRKIGKPIVSMDSALYTYHAAPFSNVFEEGATITGDMWVPMPGVPRLLGRKRFPPKRFADEVGPLFTVKKGGSVMLWSTMNVTKREAAAGPPYKIRLSAIRRAASGTGKGVKVAVPVYSSVKVRKFAKRLSIQRIIADGASQLPSLYLQNLKVD